MMLCMAVAMHGQNVAIEDVIEDIFNQLSEEDEVVQEEVQEQLMNIAAHPIDLNHTNADELRELMFLSDEQIDAILLYQYKHAFEEIYELQLIDCLKDYEIRNLLPFVEVKGEKQKIRGERLEARSKDMYFREVFHYGKHELTLRTDARNIEDYKGDPMYGKLRYRFNYQNRVQAGVTAMMAAGDGRLAIGERWKYGGFIELRDIGMMKRIVAGNYQASFGYGLVLGSPFKRGKSAYIQSTATTDEGVKKYSSVGDTYNYLHGVGATARVSKWAEVSAMYSLREGKEASWKHVIGVNATGRWKQLKVGVTAVEEIEATPSQFRERSQASYSLEAKGVMGVNARWNKGKVDLWGEVATSQGNEWGVASIAGIRYTPISDVNVVGIYRYYSPEFDNTYANALCSWSRMKDEHGGYIGVAYNRLKNWQLSAYGDVWKTGFETMAQADFVPQKDYRIHTLFRMKRKDEKDTYSLRWNMVYEVGAWKMKTQADGNMVYTQGGVSYGWSVLQDVEYRFRGVPIVLQMRLQAFDAKEWDNRIYIYENDVLYAYAIPFVYGMGGRFWLNARYKINDTFSVYLRVSETVYQQAWANAHDKHGTRTDVHVLLRVKL